MSKYRKVDSRIWNDAKFRSMSDNGKLIFLMLLTHPSMTALGAMRATEEGLAAEMGWSLKAFREAFREALAKGMAKHDGKACFVWLPNFLKYNRPESPNVVKAWSGSLDLLPECNLKNQLIQHVKDFTEGLTEGFRKALPEAFAKAMPYQEQEQEQEQEQDKNTMSGFPPDGAEPPPDPLEESFNEFWNTYPRKAGKQAAWKAWRKRKPNQQLISTIHSDICTRVQRGHWEPNNPARKQFIPHASTYLNGEGWKDEIIGNPKQHTQQGHNQGRLSAVGEVRAARERAQGTPPGTPLAPVGSHD